MVICLIDKADFRFHIVDNLIELLQKAYFMCAYECFDRSKRQEEISSCVENCSIPLSNVQHTFDHEMAQFQVTHNSVIIFSVSSSVLSNLNF